MAHAPKQQAAADDPRLPQAVKAIIVADGDVSAVEGLSTELAGAASAVPLVIAADGGALKAGLLGLRPDVVIGDLDSLSPGKLAELEASGVEVIRHPIDKDASDTELAVLEAVRRGATEIVIVAALGGLRFDHALANLLLLGLPELGGIDVRLVDGGMTVRLIGAVGEGSLAIEGAAGDIVSLLPLSEVVAGVRTDGLAFPLRGETLRQGYSRGLSNVLAGAGARVSTQGGRLAVIHTRGAAPVAAHE